LHERCCSVVQPEGSMMFKFLFSMYLAAILTLHAKIGDRINKYKISAPVTLREYRTNKGSGGQ
jgi:hypothetical protein